MQNQQPIPIEVPYQGAAGGIIGAFERVRLRKQIKYANEAAAVNQPTERFKDKYAHKYSNQTYNHKDVKSFVSKANKGVLNSNQRNMSELIEKDQHSLI